MKVTMVVESMFGHTEELAQAVAHGLRDRGAAVVVVSPEDPVGHELGDVDLLVLAAPTHALSMGRRLTRADAVSQGADPARASTGIREWLVAHHADGLGDGPPVAVFDTRATITRHWPGSAARAMARALRRRGFDVTRRTTFYVTGVTGPIARGEAQRARHWGESLVSTSHDTGGSLRL